jgi:ATP-dependent helicase/nuclease subunit A
MTFKQAIRRLQQRVLDVKEEGESVLAEENIDAVRIMSIHKSKGLEFPIVVLAGCHAGTDGRQRRGAEALFDWSTSLTGISVGPFTNLAGLYIAEKNRLRAEEEQKRIFYVATTRAREHLIISSGPSTKRSGNFISMLDELLGDATGGTEPSAVLAIGPGKLQIERVNATLSAPGRVKRKKRSPQKKRHWQPYVELWTSRRRRYEAALGAPAFVTPTSLKRQAQELSPEVEPSQRQSLERAPALLIGDLSHRFLEKWDFKEGKKAISDGLDLFLADRLPRESQKEAAHIRSELAMIFERFANSDTYAELARARILGREVPLLMPWGDSVMEGVIDLIYEHNGLLYVADYKTDRIERKDLRAAPEKYRHQAEIYSRATRQTLNRDVAAFKLIFLRLGETVEVDLSANKELWLF